MLWYKAWRESRVRFLLILVFMTAYCILDIFYFKYGHPVPSFARYAVYVWFYINNKMRAISSFIYIPLLGMGGLLWERGRGTAPLSLSLPASRTRLVGVRSAVGLVQMAAIAIVPAILVPALSPVVGESYPVSAAFHFAILWTVYGSAAFAIAFLFSTVCEGQYTALVGSFITIIVLNVLLAQTRFSTTGLLSGTERPVATAADVRAFSGLPSPFPWLALFSIAIVACGLLALAIKITQRQDF